MTVKFSLPFSREKSEKRPDFFSVWMLGICVCFYLFFAFFDGAVICVDSPSYIQMDLSREPLYSLLLAVFRRLFAASPQDFYLTAVAFFQSLLAAFASWSLAAFLRRECRLSRSVSLAVLFMPLAVSLLCRFAARRGSMYSNSILTEGIAISLYLLFFRYLLEYFFRQTRKSLLLCVLLSFLMISTRKQMMISLAMLMVCVVLVYLKKAGTARIKSLGRGLAAALVCACAVLGGTTVFDLGYNYALRGEAVRHSSDGRFVTTMAFYTAQRSDAEYIEDEGIRQLFLEIYDTCDQAGYLKHSAGKGWLNRVSHFGDYYDCIQIDTLWPAVNEYVRQHYESDGVSLSENADRIMQEINRAVLPHNLGAVFGSFLDNFLSGLITTVAQRNVILNWYSLFVYLWYILLLLWNIRLETAAGKKGIDRDCGSRAVRRKIIALAGLTLLSILCNVGLVSLVIFCQTRYTIYNMALFYISLILLLYESVAGKCGERIPY